jgi:hypothetical protein
LTGCHLKINAIWISVFIHDIHVYELDTVEFFSKWRTGLVNFWSSATFLWRTVVALKKVRHFLNAPFSTSATFYLPEKFEKLDFRGCFRRKNRDLEGRKNSRKMPGKLRPGSKIFRKSDNNPLKKTGPGRKSQEKD